MALRTRTIRLLTLLAGAVGLALAAVVTGAPHEQDVAVLAPGFVGQAPARDEAVAMPRHPVGLELTLGLKDTQRTPWEGEIRVSEGRVVGLEVVRSAPDPEVEGNTFRFATKKAAANKKGAANKKKAAAKKKAQQKAAAGVQPAVLRANLDAPETATVTVVTGAGEFSFKPGDLKRGQRSLFLDGQAAIVRQDASIRLTGRGTEDDFPSAARAPDGTVWVAFTEYTPEAAHLTQPPSRDQFDTLVPTKNGDRIRLRSFDGTTWSPGIDVTEGGRDVWRPTVAVDGRGQVRVSWAQQVEGDWEILTRVFAPAKAGAPAIWSDPERVTRAKGSDFHVVSATDSKGVVWLAWQAFRGGNYEVLALPLTDAREREPKIVSASAADDWSPAIAADGQGGVFVAWDTYDQGNYDVLVRDVTRPAAPIAVAASSRFEARASLAVDKGNRVWVTYEEGDEQWGKDFAHGGNVGNVGLEKNPGFALYINRTVKLKCVDGGKVMAPAAGVEPDFGPFSDRNKSLPRLAFAGDGTLWMFVRHHPLPGKAGEVWVSSAFAFSGEAWSAPRLLASSENLMDNRPALAAVGDDLLAVYSTDHRQNSNTRVEDDLYATRLASESPAAANPRLVDDAPTPKAAYSLVHPNEKADIAKIREYRLTLGDRTLRPLRGEFHRHTEVSSHNDGDGLLEDTWRYALDAADHDWMGNGDHDNGFGFEYIWWIIQKTTDIHHNPPRFVAAQTYERSVVYPNGHRNVMMPRRGIRPLPRGGLPGTEEEGTPDTKLLYAYLKHFGGLCASHTSATNMGTDWRDNDPEVEPVVEIYQGHRHNYETPGAPRSPSEATQIGGFQPKGFVWNALKKGYKLGFESSSDHVSTHLSYAILFAEDTSRAALIDAFKKRHCYAATDNILLDVRSGDHLMGDIFTTNERPGLQVIVKGTAPVARLHVIRDDKYALSTEPNARDVTFRYADEDAKPGETHYYYVRVEQADGNLAWGSPVWVTYAK